MFYMNYINILWLIVYRMCTIGIWCVYVLYTFLFACVSGCATHPQHFAPIPSMLCSCESDVWHGSPSAPWAGTGPQTTPGKHLWHASCTRQLCARNCCGAAVAVEATAEQWAMSQRVLNYEVVGVVVLRQCWRADGASHLSPEQLIMSDYWMRRGSHFDLVALHLAVAVPLS